MNDTMEDKLLQSSEDDGKDLKLRIWVESKKFWTIACLAIIMQLISFEILVAQSFIRHIGLTVLSSYALVQTFLLHFANGMLLGMLSALETLCGQAYGAKQYHIMGIYMQRSWVVVLATATLMVPLFIFATLIFGV